MPNPENRLSYGYVVCQNPDCGKDYDPDDHDECPYC